MAATVVFYQTNGAAPGVDTAQGTGNGSNDWDFKNVDTPGPAVLGEEITAGDFSYHVYVKAYFAGSFSSISNVKYYASNLNLTGAGTDAYIVASGVAAANYAQPSNVSRSGVWRGVPVYAASGIDIGTASLAAGTPGFTKYVALQLKTVVSNATPGVIGYTTFTLTYDEI
jgi:hypothetical protein